MKKIILCTALTLGTASAFAQIREFQTTRLQATAGAGVASILSTEAALLNPASSAFFNGSGASYQSYRTNLEKKSHLRRSSGDDFAERNRSQGFFMSDNSGELKGGLAYIQQAENHYRRERMVFHSAAPIAPNASIGFSYNYIQDKWPQHQDPRHRVHHQMTAGFSYIVDEDTALGLVIQDPTLTTPGEERIIAGFQYNIASRLTLIGDVGARYTKDVSEEYLWRAAVQINIFSDFFLRGGQFYDNIRELKGTGWGVAWIGPRLGIEFAQKMSEQFGRKGYIYQDEKLVDTSLSAMIKF